MYILCIRYGTVLANTAVLCIRGCIICLPICGTPWWVLLEHSNYVVISFHHRVWYHTLSLCYACIWSSDIILIPQATSLSYFISFAASIAELANGEKSRTESITQSLTHSAYLMPRQLKFALQNTQPRTDHKTFETYQNTNHIIIYKQTSCNEYH